jgi:competence ComEA-like helix-hairpin-helix protein
VSDDLKSQPRRFPFRRFIAVSLSFIFLALRLVADTKRLPAVHSVDLNSATAEELQQVPGVGASTAKAIVDFRQKSGPFQNIDDLLAIKGISKARLDKMRPYLTIGPPVQKSP